MSDLAQWKVHGPVEALRAEFATWDAAQGDWKSDLQSTVTSFRPDGKVSATDHYNRDGSIAHSRWFYDQAGRLTHSDSWMNDGPVSRTHYSYDEAGRPVRTWHVSHDGVMTESEACSYDADGMKTKVHFGGYHEGNAFASVEGTDVACSIADTVISSTTYDRHDLPVQVVYQDANHRPIRTVTMQRDSSGRLMNLEVRSESLLEQMAAKAPPENREQMMAMLKQVLGDTCSRTTYSYDARGRMIEQINEIGSLGGHRTTYRYDDHDDPIEETTEHNSRQASLTESGPQYSASSSNVQHNRLAYRYDAHGNWTERIVSIRLEPADKFQPSNIERRTISYCGE